MIDSHHHIWRQHDLPWLLGPEVPRIFGSYKAIKRDYLIDEYLQDIKKSGISKSVYVQANWAPNWYVDEAAWVQSVSDKYGWPHAMVAFADFTVEDVTPQLEKLSQFDIVRGIRQQLDWHVNPEYRFAPDQYIANNPNFQKNIARLADYNWSFDLQIFSKQWVQADNLLKACPDVNFILQHAGMLNDVSDDGWREWRQAMAALAKNSNLFVKLSGLGTFNHCVDFHQMEAIVNKTVEIFGARRCMFGSNFPIEKIWTSYDQLFEAYSKIVGNFDSLDVDSIFHDTAQSVYRL